MMTFQWMKNNMKLVFSILIVLYTSTLLSNDVNFQTAKLYKADISAQEAYKMQQNGAILIDVRTKREFNTLRAKDSHNIPIFYEKNKQRVFNKNFLKEIYLYSKKDINKEIILICRSGSRTKLASNLLAYQGFKNIYNVKYGFDFDWIKQKLPSTK
ncbi:rhodanese-like domain-containing protein [Arcobacter roscoffensis]|uniref:Rhodanese-like domain-containing protein n=1 Tax=Arcobacter roscoffensis TaxID=2961520 RepID=A0ABY5E3B9_9BACT|nr:rhodanese-like domain-containing protein [Arcobacter roscoffensis]UTJ05553.1 rhodanese-like domain-containing protein [Arcobacter roscoffensis]